MIKLGPADQQIYLDIQAGLKDAIVERVAVVGAGSDVKEVVSFILAGGVIAPSMMKIMAVSPGHSPEDFTAPDTKCRPLVEARWYACRIN